VPDFSQCNRLERVVLSECNFNGILPKEWPTSLGELRVQGNPNLAGTISAKVILQCESIRYRDCKPRYDAFLKKKNDVWMTGPFIVGASMASENIWHLLLHRANYNISAEMIKDPPVKGDESFDMFKTHGEDWVAWQELWLTGLQGLRDRDVFVVVKEFRGTKHFRTKFETDTDEDENRKNCFDPKYKLPDGQRARCILDWERRQMLAIAPANNLRIVYVCANDSHPVCSARVDRSRKRPDWYA
jgi:hypothetical protein